MYLFTGGKTGGHIMPLISIIKDTKEKVIYVGQDDSLEEKICKENQIDFIGYPKNKNRIMGILLGYRYLVKKLNSYKIKAIIASGGFVSTPACLYGIRHKIPIFLIEENIILGDSNRLFYPFCKKLFLAYELDKKRKKEVICGMPLRKMVINNSYEGYDALVIGGSLGSRVLCDAAVELSKSFKVCLIAGGYAKDYKSDNNLKVISFSSDIYSLMNKAKVIIARAGASTAAEIFYINKPFICIPSMKTKKNHQYYNAKYFSDSNACLLCLEKSISTDLNAHVANLINNEHMRINMLSAQKKLVNKEAKAIILKCIKENLN